MMKSFSWGWLGVLPCALLLTAAATNPGSDSSRARTGTKSVPAEMLLIPAGIYLPSFRTDSGFSGVSISPFAIDRTPVTNSDFLEFVRANPRWRRSAVKSLFADAQYLRHWSGDTKLGPTSPGNAPVTWVSWFAARAFAQWKGKRLPSTAEWEFVAAASPSRPDGANDPEFVKAIQNWMASPSPTQVAAVGRGRANVYGVHDLHGLVWEWVSDFSAAMTTGDARGDMGLEQDLFCGAGAQGAKDISDYAAYLRFGFRSSLQARYTVHNLGFRCAKTL